MMSLWGLFFAAIGVFSVCAGIFNWEWFMNARKARFIVKLFGRNGARVFYALLGAALIVLGILGLTGVIVFEE